MAIASVGTMGAVGDGTSGTSIVLTTATTSAAAGSLVVVMVAKDNASAAADSQTSEITSVTDSVGGNTWIKGGEFTNSNAAADAGATSAIWYSVLANAIPTSSTITANFSDARVASAISAWNFSLSTGSQVFIHAGIQTLANDAADPGALTYGFTSGDQLFLRSIAAETNAVTALTPSAGWTAITGAQAGASVAAGMAVRGEFRIAFSNGNNSPTISSDPTLAAVDCASVSFGLKECFADSFNEYGSIVTGSSNASSTTVASSAINNHGPNDTKNGWKSLLVASIVFDNTGTGADGDLGEVTGVADDDGNTWTKAGEFVNTQGGAGAGVGVAVFYLSPPASLTSAIVTATFTSARVAKHICIWGYMFPSTYTLSMESFTGLANDAADPGSINPAVSNATHVWHRAIGYENGTVQSLTATANFFQQWNQVVGVGAAGMGHVTEARVFTGAANASDPTLGGSQDVASGYAVFSLTAPSSGVILDPFGMFGFFGH